MPSADPPNLPNAPDAVAARARAGLVPATAPVLVAFVRLVLAWTVHGLVALGSAAAGSSDAWEAAARWMTVWATAVDLGSLAVLALLLRRERLRLRDLFRATAPTWRDVPAGLGVLVVMGVVGFAGGALAGLLCYGTPTPDPPMSPLPLWGALYSTLVWPVVWGVTEEATYNGYVAPRLRARTSAGLTVAVIALGWSLQHTGLPAHLDPTYAVFRTLSSLPIAIGATLFYLRTRRLVPLAIAHVLIDAASGALTFRAG